VQVDVEVWPIQMLRVVIFNFGNGSYRGIFKLGEIMKSQKQFTPFKENPKSMLGNVGNFNC
jgi:hypothetical protein